MSTSSLVQIRCLTHPDREAVARCFRCSEHFCRECIGEYDGRMVCSTCLKRDAAKAAEPQHRRTQARLLSAVRLCCGATLGFILLWSLIAVTGLLILRIPAEFHDGSIWTSQRSWE